MATHGPGELIRPIRPLTRNRVGAFMGTTLVLLLLAAVLLASRDLWTVEARAIGRLLDAAGVSNEVVTSPTRLARTEIGELSRSGEVRRAHAPLVTIDPPVSQDRPTGEQAAAAGAALVATIAALAIARRVAAPIKGAVLIAGLVAVGTLAYGAWWSDLAPLDLRHVLVDWRTSALVPMLAISLLFAYDIYPLPGSFLIKSVWLTIAVGAVAVFSTVRMAFVAAAYAEFGPPAFLPLHQAAGMFWDLAPGIAVLAFAQAGLSFVPATRLGLRRRR